MTERAERQLTKQADDLESRMHATERSLLKIETDCTPLRDKF